MNAARSTERVPSREEPLRVLAPRESAGKGDPCCGWLRATLGGPKLPRMKLLGALRRGLVACFCAALAAPAVAFGAPEEPRAVPSPSHAAVPAEPPQALASEHAAPATVEDAELAGADEEPVPAEHRQRADTDPRALAEFRADLGRYGSWVDDPKYGTIWIPDPQVVGSDFAPYVTSGHWALSARGTWVWVSTYPFAPVVYHYGRWVFTPYYGWGWIPGYRYADAWVTWRVPVGAYAYVGWAPLPPEYIWVNGRVVWIDWYPSPLFVFVWSHYLFSPHVHYYLLHHHHLHDAVRHTRRYAPSNPRKRNSDPPRGPSLSAARVPKSLAPNAALRAGPRTLTASPRASALLSGRSVRGLRTSDFDLIPRARGATRGSSGGAGVDRSLVRPRWPGSERWDSAVNRPAARPQAPSAVTPRRSDNRPSRASGSSARPTSPARLRPSVRPTPSVPRSVSPRAVTPPRARSTDSVRPKASPLRPRARPR